MDQTQLLFLQRTINLVQAGFRKAFISPVIGWVVVQHNQLLSEGWLDPKLPFKPQLEVSLSALSLQPDAQLFISSNPFGTTEELHQLVDRYKINHVMIAEETSEVASELWYTNRRLQIYHREKRPYIILKWAQTADGFIARSNYDSKWISGVHARKLVHQWRAQEAAIWVGKNTYRYDNPRLNVRNWVGEDPVRVVIDPQRTLDLQLHVFDQSQPTLYYSTKPQAKLSNLESVALPKETDWEQLVSYVLSDLYQRQITSLFVEGGSQLLSFLIAHHYWDEARIFVSETTFGSGIAAPSIDSKYLVSQEKVSEDQLFTYHRFGLEAEKKIKEEE